MPKRFTDKNKWDDEWYSMLDNDCKIVWEYLLDRCDHAGVGKVNLRMINFCCNVTWNNEKLEQIFISRIMFEEKFYFIVGYLKFQYPKGLNNKKPAIVSVRNILNEKGLTEYVNSLYGDSYLMVNQSLPNGYVTIKDKDKDKDKDKVKDKDIPPVGILNASPEQLTFSLQQVENEFFKQGLTDKDAEKFYNHYQSQGWVKGNGLPISDLSSQVTNWRLNPKQYEVKEDDAKATVRKAMQYAEESRNRREGNGTLAKVIPSGVGSTGESIF